MLKLYPGATVRVVHVNMTSTRQALKQAKHIS